MSGTPIFLQYINDVAFSLKHCQAIMYTDDTSISLSIKNIEDLINIVNNVVVPLEELCGSKLSLNVVQNQP